MMVFRDLVQTELELAERSRVPETRDPDRPSYVPPAIQQQRSFRTKQAWLQIQAIIIENETLPEDERVPDPYFARAQIWSSVNNYPQATKDYLRALEYASSSSRRLLSYARYYPKVQTAVNRFSRIPSPATGLSSDVLNHGAMHFASGVTAFRLRKYDEALGHFDNAVSVQPDNPTYWYYRSVTSRRLGEDEEASFGVLYGAFAERELASVSRSRQITKALQHIQGDDRMWLELYRLGDPSARILHSMLNERSASESL